MTIRTNPPFGRIPYRCVIIRINSTVVVVVGLIGLVQGFVHCIGTLDANIQFVTILATMAARLRRYRLLAMCGGLCCGNHRGSALIVPNMVK